MDWFALILAGSSEVLGVLNIKRLTMKKWDGAIYLILSFGASLFLLSYAMKTIPMGTAYGVWTGIGTIGSTLLGMFLYGEPKEWKRIFFIALILASAIGLKLIS
ncbi:multidrug efflux SMR transporter [Neobacillus sp. FSL H8-0543]|jgi:paired small multidrug resistance pump|uniref:DMT family transporter n=1 Tax=Neobacillus sp. FSL H8-0543 TaxID=2954672 RepID=UPI0031589C80